MGTLTFRNHRRNDQDARIISQAWLLNRLDEYIARYRNRAHMSPISAEYVKVLEDVLAREQCGEIRDQRSPDG